MCLGSEVLVPSRAARRRLQVHRLSSQELPGALVDAWLTCNPLIPGCATTKARVLCSGLPSLQLLELFRSRLEPGSSVVCTSKDSEQITHWFEEHRLLFSIRTAQYSPPWYMDTSKMEHLTVPVQVCRSLHGRCDEACASDRYTTRGLGSSSSVCLKPP